MYKVGLIIFTFCEVKLILIQNVIELMFIYKLHIHLYIRFFSIFSIVPPILHQCKDSLKNLKVVER